MEFDKFIQEAQEAFASAQKLVISRKQQQIDVEHLLISMINQKSGLALQILQKLSVNIGWMSSQLEDEINKLPRVEGAGEGQIYVSARLNQVVTEAFNEMKML